MENLKVFINAIAEDFLQSYLSNLRFILTFFCFYCFKLISGISIWHLSNTMFGRNQLQTPDMNAVFDKVISSELFAKVVKCLWSYGQFFYFFCLRCCNLQMVFTRVCGESVCLQRFKVKGLFGNWYQKVKKTMFIPACVSHVYTLQIFSRFSYNVVEISDSVQIFY